MLNENELATWFIFSVLPIALAIATFAWKINKDKKNNENRITKIEANVSNNKNDVKEVKDELRQQREEIKIILQISSKIDTLTTRFENFENRFYDNRDNN